MKYFNYFYKSETTAWVENGHCNVANRKLIFENILYNFSNIDTQRFATTNIFDPLIKIIFAFCR